MNWIDSIKQRFWKRYTDNLFELEKRRLKKQERQKKKQESMMAGTISYGIAMHQKPWEVYHSVLDKRKADREDKKKG
jgi:hypothetical protein